MKTGLARWNAAEGWTDSGVTNAHLALCFTSRAALSGGCVDALKTAYPDAIIASCSTGGEIVGRDVLDDAASAALIRFDHSNVTSTQTSVETVDDSFMAGLRLGKDLTREDLRCVIVLSDGLHVNGARLVEGLRAALPDDVVIAGGLAGDGAAFQETFVGLNVAPTSKQLVAIGLHGARLNVSASSMGGWDVFGPERRITRAEGSVLYELDGQPALALYKKYLGEEAAHLPASALNFPLSIRRDQGDEEPLTRTIVGVNEDDQSLIFAGEMPQGWTAQLMRGVCDRIVTGAAGAARAVQIDEVNGDESLGLLISCIGRKLMLGQRVQEEVEAVCDEWPGTPVVGFYSYGEIGPHGATGRCTLHNQTMTALLLSES
jgi:hypothetical protein